MQLLKMGRAEDPLPPQKLPDYRLTTGPVDRIGELPVFLSNLLRIVHVRRRRRTQDRQTCVDKKIQVCVCAFAMCFRSPDHPVASCQGRTVNERRQVLLCPYGTLVLVIRPHWIANDVMISRGQDNSRPVHDLPFYRQELQDDVVKMRQVVVKAFRRSVLFPDIIPQSFDDLRGRGCLPHCFLEFGSQHLAAKFAENRGIIHSCTVPIIPQNRLT